jgi:molybdenum cofactor sulfurtransferase
MAPVSSGNSVDLSDREAYIRHVLDPPGVAPECAVAMEVPAEEGERRADFLARWGEGYGLGGRLEALRGTEFRRLGAAVYLDFAGAGLYQESQIREYSDLLTNNVFGNPHSLSACSVASQARVESARTAALSFFHTDDDAHDVVFAANATAALKLVGESFPWQQGSIFMHTVANHTSVLGIRQFAAARGATVVAVTDTDLALLLRDPATFRATASIPEASAPCLFAFAAEDNFNGRVLPLPLAGHVKAALGSQWAVLVDAACFAPSAPLDAGSCAADFIAVSIAKMVGHPQVGALLLRRPAGYLLERPYFGGGTVVECAAGSPWQLWREFPSRFEDGTVPFLALAVLPQSLERLRTLGMAAVAAHTGALARWLAAALGGLRHANGAPVCRIHGRHGGPKELQGPMVTFNVLRPDGSFVKLTEVAAHLTDSGVQVRAGSLCNPGSCHTDLGIPEALVVQRDTLGGCGWDDLVEGRPLGAVRASIGYPTVWEDVDRLFTTVRTRFRR